jgi:methylated-DNA-[protein]-cysteine S-methyltransferase
MHVVVDSPIDPLGVSLDGETVVGVRFDVSLPAAGHVSGPGAGDASGTGAGDASGTGGRGAGVRVADELRAYFAGTLTEFTVPVEMRGGSEFERSVWAEIAKIPYGEMITYGEIATALGDLGLSRAVGTACNHNPVPVIVPCHRVVGAGGKMVGFGGGLDRKRKLLEMEARVALERSWADLR